MKVSDEHLEMLCLAMCSRYATYFMDPDLQYAALSKPEQHLAHYGARATFWHLAARPREMTPGAALRLRKGSRVVWTENGAFDRGIVIARVGPDIAIDWWSGGEHIHTVSDRDQIHDMHRTQQRLKW